MLERLGLMDLAPAFERERLTVPTIALLDDGDLRGMGVPLVDRARRSCARPRRSRRRGGQGGDSGSGEARQQQQLRIPASPVQEAKRRLARAQTAPHISRGSGRTSGGRSYHSDNDDSDDDPDAPPVLSTQDRVMKEMAEEARRASEFDEQAAKAAVAAAAKAQLERGGGGGGDFVPGTRRRALTDVSANAEAAKTAKEQCKALNVAAKRGRVAEIQELVGAGVDVNNTLGGAGRTPLHWASQKGQLEAVELMLQLGANAATKDHSGQTALHWAASKGCAAVSKVLLAGGASISAADKHANTPLHIASQSGHLSLVRLLLEEGANHKLTTSKHYTALDVAQLFDQHAVSEVLRAHAAAVG